MDLTETHDLRWEIRWERCDLLQRRKFPHVNEHMLPGTYNEHRGLLTIPCPRRRRRRR